MTEEPSTFYYGAVVEVIEERLQVHKADWVLSHPLFHPEDYAPSEEEGARLMAMAVFEDKLPKPGMYLLKAEGQFVFDFSEDLGMATCEVQLTSYSYTQADQNVVNAFTKANWGRASYCNVTYRALPQIKLQT